MANGLDVVSVRIQNECPIVVGVVVRTKARSPVIKATGSNGRFMERVDEGTARNAKRNVGRRNVGCPTRDPEVRLGRHPETGYIGVARNRGGKLHDQLIADWREGMEIEGLGPPEVADCQTCVIDH
jgi:hypothetical protein